MEPAELPKKVAGEMSRKKEEREAARVYSGIDQLPHGFASRNFTLGCLVLEGGGFRGLYTGGVIDALMENDINLQATVGVSAGALYGMCYAGAQLGSARINLKYRHDDRYVGGRALISNHGIMGWDFLFDDLALPTTESCRRFYDDNRRLTVVVSNVDTGQAEYLEKGDHDHESCDDIIAAVCASASLPFVSEPVQLATGRYLDGGCCDKIPFQWAVDQGYRNIVVVRTQHADYRKKNTLSSRAGARMAYGKSHPEFAAALAGSNQRYNEQCDQLDKLVAQGRVFCLAPSRPVDVGRLEGDMEKLGELYHLGYDDTMARLDGLRAYLER
ncbi:MAG: patatin family protein [Coriobacteriia bacterium]|nr:patatin family protein [Coriobacteriia bacterium]